MTPMLLVWVEFARCRAGAVARVTGIVVVAMADHVELEVPLSARYASTVRAVAAASAADAGFSVDEIDDLRLGVNEAISILADVDDADAGRLSVRFEIDGEAVHVVASRSGVGGIVSGADLDPIASRILAAVVDHVSIDDGAIRLVKRRSGGPDADG